MEIDSIYVDSVYLTRVLYGLLASMVIAHGGMYYQYLVLDKKTSKVMSEMLELIKQLEEQNKRVNQKVDKLTDKVFDNQ